ncbi:beta strand repeat-containing protein [Terriglobus albidus]|uniref:beta strand repeat-containing protein n=1 Tax=Terriglobus albidus TaxID=1592106 RepID=UPI00164ED449|nr:putative Ig domain-containing protein [Terriglobus albidus]
MRKEISVCFTRITQHQIAFCDRSFGFPLFLLTLTLLLLGTNGCGWGGSRVNAASATSTITLNAGQSIQIPATTTSSTSWAVNGTGCSDGSCGTVTPGSGYITYVAPQTVSSPLHTTINATLVTASDAGSIAVTVNPALTVTANLDSATVGSPYSGLVTTAGGSNPVQSSISSGNLPAGLSFDPSTSKIAGTPTAAGTYTFTFKTTDASDAQTNVVTPRTIRVGSTVSPITITSRSLPRGTVGAEYSTQLSATGGSSSYSWAASSGSLPTGLTLSSTGAISGVPANAGTFAVTVTVTDATGASTSTPLTLTVAASTLTVTTTSLPSGTVGTSYTAAISAVGGVSPYACAVASGSLPNGLSLSNCAISGTPTAAANSSLVFAVTDAAGTSASSKSLALTIADAATLDITSPASGTVGVGYSASIGVSGGKGPYTCSMTDGTLPAGILLNNCTLQGTPTTAGVYTLGISATDSSKPTAQGKKKISVVIQGSTTQLTITSPSTATVGQAYNDTIGITGGTSPYACSIVSGTLPSGLSINNCTITGTPSAAGSTSLVVKATDSNHPTDSATASITLTVIAAPATLTLSSPPSGTVGALYNGAIGVAGGTAPYSCTLASGTIPNGLTLTGCSLTGTPTTAGNSTFSIKATDSSGPANATTGPVTLSIAAAPVTLALTAPPSGNVGVAYNGTIGVSGGTAPYTCSLASGSMPSGLTLNSCTISGTPLVAGSYSLSIKATDSASPANTTTATVPLNIIGTASVTLSISSPVSATVGTAYTGAIGVSGGSAPYACSLVTGSVPGLTLSGCSLTGTPTTAGTYSLSVKATDSSSPANSTTGAVSVTVKAAAAATLTLTSPTATATVGTAYTGTIGVSGGTAPYACSLVSGSVPGLTLSGCSLTGTPTTAGTYSLSVKATDSSNPANSTTGTVTVAVKAAAATTLTLTSPTAAATVGTAYTGTIGVSGGTAPYTCALVSGSVPGLTLSGCSLSGTPTTAGTYSLSVKATDSSSPANSTTGTVTVTVNAAVTLTLTSPTTATVGSAYTGTIGVSGGTAPYTCTLTSGTVPAGLTLTNCSLSGTPTTAGASTLTIKATDSSSPAASTTGTVVVTVNTASSSGSSGGPHINYTDLNVGSGTGGDNGNGVYVRIFGSNFGSTQGSSTVALGGQLITNCSLCSWSDTTIIAQLGSAATTGNIVVTVNGAASNGVPFTVTQTDIVFVSPNGADTNTGSFTSPFKSWRAAFNSVTSSDSMTPVRNTVIYLLPGTDVSFDDGRGYKSAISTDIGGSSPTSQLSIVGYPGGTVNVGSSSITYGVHGWGKYVTIANLNIVGQSSAIDAEAGNARIINNSLSCPAPPSGLGGTACLLGETTDPSETWAVHGNNVHDTGGNVDKTYHAVYFSSNVNHADVGWNNVGQNFKGYCRGIMFHATLGSNQYDLHIHDNVVTNSYCDGIALASVNPSQGTVEIYNNVVAHVALASNPYGVANEAGIAINTDPAAGTSSGNVEVYNNTVVDAGAYTLGNQNGCFGVVSSGAGMHLTNNICSQPSSSQPYVESGSTNVSGSRNLWYGAGTAPSWDSSSISSNPLFVSTSNFALQSQSPAKSTGTTSTTSTIDIVGASRGSTPSMGAYQ